MVLIILHRLVTVTAGQTETLNIGAIIDVDTRVGKEAAAGMMVAAQSFNKSSFHHKISFHFYNAGGNPLRAARAAEELIVEKDVKAIVCIVTWDQTSLLADVGNQAQVPVISLAPVVVPASNQPLVPRQWPSLLFMGINITAEISCIGSILRSFNWRKAIVIYQVDSQGGDSGTLAALSNALNDAGAEIEHQMVLPPISSLENPEGFIREEVLKLHEKQSRVFVVLQLSFSLATLLFDEAKKTGLVGKESAWIIADPIGNELDSANHSVVSSIEGALGLMTYFPEQTASFQDFRRQFGRIFRSKYPDEESSAVGIYAPRAHDSITAVGEALKRSQSMSLLEALLSSNFQGLSGRISFRGQELSQTPALKLVKVVGKRYREVGFWSPELGFQSGENRSERIEALAGEMVNWPGDLRRLPKGWSMPTVANPMKIGVPGRTVFEKFVKVVRNPTTNQWDGSGFCIDIFREVLNILEPNYSLPYVLIPYNGSYDDLVEQVANKTFDAVIGDVTILADRFKHVAFTQPYTESELTMLVTVKPQTNKMWIFVKPFTKGLWAMTIAILAYTVLIVWLLERRSNPEFDGKWWNQLNTSVWFTSSSLFFAHRERLYNNYTRGVVLVWLFVVMVLTSCYTATLSSILTVPRLRPTVTDIDWLKNNNKTVGCDGDSFLIDYLVEVHGFKDEQIKKIGSEYDYTKEFQSGNIAAAFLELPYAKAFLSHYCKGYTTRAGAGNQIGAERFGGFGFVFPKGSPLADDFSEAILTLSENGWLKQREFAWFSPSGDCRTSGPEDTDSLSWKNIWGLYLFSFVTSTVCCLLFFVQRMYERRREGSVEDIASEDDNLMRSSSSHSSSTPANAPATEEMNGEIQDQIYRSTPECQLQVQSAGICTDNLESR